MSSLTRVLALGAGMMILVGSAGAADNAPSARPTFYKDVLPIVQENCQTCHRQGGIAIAGMVAPMSFMSYQEVRPWAKSIARQVQSKSMPPWDASSLTAGVFANEPANSPMERNASVPTISSGTAIHQ